MSHLQFRGTRCLYLQLHGLVFETSICYWQDQPGSCRAECEWSLGLGFGWRVLGGGVFVFDVAVWVCCGWVVIVRDVFMSHTHTLTVTHIKKHFPPPVPFPSFPVPIFTHIRQKAWTMGVVSVFQTQPKNTNTKTQKQTEPTQSLNCLFVLEKQGTKTKQEKRVSGEFVVLVCVWVCHQLPMAFVLSSSRKKTTKKAFQTGCSCSLFVLFAWVVHCFFVLVVFL